MEQGILSSSGVLCEGGGDKMRKAVAVEITGELLQQMLTEGWEAARIRCTSGLPEGARFAGSYVRQWDGMYIRNVPSAILVFEHPDFAEIDDGDVIPFISVEHSQEYE